jgi:hypothetical protein
VCFHRRVRLRPFIASFECSETSSPEVRRNFDGDIGFEKYIGVSAVMSIFKALKKNPGSSQSDLLRRRRNKTLIINILIISVLSIVAALVITWQSGGTGFSVPDSTGQSAIAPEPFR